MESAKPDLDTFLTESSKGEFEFHADIRTRVIELSRAAEAEASRSSVRPKLWRRPRVVIGLLGLIALATAAGAVIHHLDPNSLRISGVITSFDATIPTYYETATGKTVTCEFGIVFDELHSSADVSAAKSFVSHHDWTGIGQRIYDEAIAHPFVPGPNDDIEDPTDQTVLDWFSFSNAESKLIYAEIPPEMMPDDTQSGGTQNCTGELR